MPRDDVEVIIKTADNEYEVVRTDPESFDLNWSLLGQLKGLNTTEFSNAKNATESMISAQR